jgi:RNA polymerase sigma-70 factor (ECF subfamily)
LSEIQSDQSDKQLVSQTLQGNYDAFRKLLERYQDMVYGVAYSYLRNFHDAQDLAQEVFLKVYHKLAAYDRKHAFSSWLYVIAKRAALDWLKAHQRIPESEAITEDLPDRTPGPDALVQSQEIEHQLNAALAHLSEVNRETFCLYYVNGYSINEISQFLSIPTGTVKRRLHISRKLLREEVINMTRETFDEKRLTWEFIQDVVNKVTSLKSGLADYLPAKFQELAQLTEEDLTKRRNKLLRAVAAVLEVDIQKLKLGKVKCIPVSKMNDQQREYLWNALHELELIGIIVTLRQGTIFTPLIRDFDSTEVEIGLYGNSSHRASYDHPYVRLFRRNPDGSHHSIQLGPIDEDEE